MSVPSQEKPRLVMKFGGTSVGDVERIKNVARKVKHEVDNGYQVAVVVSAMSGTTNQLVEYVSSISPLHDAREYDTVVSAGEQITIGLLATALQEIGVPARSWLGWQLPIHTDDVHSSARIRNIETDAILDRMNQGMVAVVAGFQGLGPDNRITTLGRGGSDTSAVAVAAAIDAERCDIYTDVDGVYTCDPRIVPLASRLDRISYEEMLEMASLGAKVLQTRSVELAMVHRVRLQVRSSFEEMPEGRDNWLAGTLVCDEEEIVEQAVVSGIAYSRDEAKITVTRVPDTPGVAASIFGPLAEAAVNVDMIIQNISADNHTDMTFTVPKSELARAQKVLEDAQEQIGFVDMIHDLNVVKVSVIGIGMRSHAGVAQKMFSALAEKGINIQVISTSEIKVSVLISSDYTELALRALHSAYELDAAE